METVINKIEKYKWAYKTAFGVRKYENVSSKIMSSNKIQKIFALSIQKHQAPHSLDYIYTLNTIPYFIFSSGDTQALGAILALELWMNSVNNEFHFFSDSDINQVFDGIIQECSNKNLTIRI